MDFNQLNLFLKVAKHQSFTGAAAAMGLQRSSVSRRVADLEDALGVRLFHRTTRRVRLTPSGEWLRTRVEPLLAGVERAVEAIPERAATPSGVLRVSVATDIGLYLAPFFRSFREQHPAVTVQLDVTHHRIDLEEQGIDVALRASAGELEDSHLVARPLLTMSAGMFAAPGYLDRSPPLQTRDDLPTHAMVMTSSMPAMRHIPVGRPVLFADDPLVIMACVQAGIGLGWLPLHMTRDAVDAGRLVRVLPEVEVAGVKLFAVYPPALRRIPKVRAFLSSLVEFLGPERCLRPQ